MNEQLKVIISAEVEKFKQGVQKAKGEVTDFKAKVKEASADVDKNFKDIGAGISSALKGAATAFAATGAALLALGASTAEYRAEQAKLSTAFEAAGGSAEEAKATYNDLYRVLGDSGQAVEAANHLAKLTTEEQALSEWTNICQGVYATFGDSLPIEGLTEAVNHTAQLGEVQGPLADALEWSGLNTEKFNEQLAECNTLEEREKLIRETLNGLYSDAASKYEETAADVLAQNEAQAKLQETTAALGEAVAPVITAFTQFASDALAKVLPYIQQLADQYMPLLNDLLTKLSDALSKAFDWVTKHKALLVTLAVVIGTVVTAIGLYNAVAAVKAAMAAAEVTTVWGLVAAYAAQAAAMAVAIAPYVLIVAAIAAVIAIIVLCIKHWDKIKATVTSVASSIWNAVKNAFNKVVDTISNTMGKARDKVKSIIEKIKSFFNFKWSLPKLKMPSVKITGKFSLSPLSVPKFSISWNELGGVFDKPTLFNYGGSLQGLGENGAEAVVPLENNLEWLNKLANMLNERMGNNPVVLTVDGKVFAQTAISTINQQTRQTGKLALNIL